jgi:LPXTG-motif cell wall-anchored protein
MKKILTVLAVSVMSLSFGGSVAFAADISNTGPGSYNSIIDETTKKITVTCNNNVEVVNNNGQVSNSGTAVVDGNTYGGNATSGDATNLNTFVANLGISCVTKETPVVVPETGGQGGGVVLASSTPAPAPVAAALPETGPSALSTGLVIAGSLVLGGIGLVRRSTI